ncbi:hypothetical protein Q3V23_12535 [Streptomyces sp. VNUA116]|uniref:hypothetical protein n=1 Tax=Streptomyces sp. VNUA116 TaxID=3062449 RepID=UPI002674B6CA|nr:hypothetical protein [Streptomyces sp. VNUA116]WKU44834.1 hypothetical protein Q3V23_12535 [Streptomyces sp. VNUA116]
MTDDRNQPQPPPGPQTPPAPLTPPNPQTPPGPWPPPIPDRPSGKGKAIGITAGALVFAGALVGGLLYFNDGSGDGAAAYRIEMPQTLVDGEYKRDKDDGAEKDTGISAKDRAEMKSFGIEDADGDAGSYQSDKRGALQVASMYGKIPDPEKTIALMVARMDKGGREDGTAPMGGKVERGTYKDYRPHGFDGVVLKCKADKISFSFGDLNSTTSLGQCLWADKGIIGTVMSQPFGAKGNDKGMSAEELAEMTTKIRKEVRKPR